MATYDERGLRVRKMAEQLDEAGSPLAGSAPRTAALLFDAANPTGYAQAVEEFDVVAGAPSSWVRTRSTVVGLDVLSTSTPRFAYPQSQGEPVPQPDAPLVMVYDAGGSVRDVLANHEAAGDLFTFAERADGATGDTPGALNPVLPQRADYDAFGELILFAPAGQSTPSVRRSQRDAAITDLEEALLSHLTYRGEQYDPHLRMQYLRARHYDQGTGRFTRVDPFAGAKVSPQTYHKYVYADANPTMGIDPTGEFTLVDVQFSFTTALRTFGTVASKVLAVKKTVDLIHMAVDISSFLVGGGLSQVKASWTTIAALWPKNGNSVSARLARPQFWAEAAESVVSLGLGMILGAVEHHGDDILKAMKVNGPVATRWLIWAPTPFDKWIPNPRIGPIALPFANILKHKVSIQFGWGGYRGRLFGFGWMVGNSPARASLHQAFRIDYHDPHGRNAKKDHWYGHVVTGAYEFHGHVPKMST